VRLSMSWSRPIAGGLVALTALTFTAPAVAGESLPSAAPTTRLSDRAAASVAKLKPTPRAFVQQAAPAQTESSGSFFKSRTGIAAIVLMVAGAGYVAYRIPRDSDKVHSPVRE
jgi:hypothetical protein